MKKRERIYISKIKSRKECARKYKKTLLVIYKSAIQDEAIKNNPLFSRNEANLFRVQGIAHAALSICEIWGANDQKLEETKAALDQLFETTKDRINQVNAKTGLQSLVQHYSSPPHSQPVPGGKHKFETYDEAEIWIDRHGETNRTYTILPIYRPKPH